MVKNSSRGELQVDRNSTSFLTLRFFFRLTYFQASSFPLSDLYSHFSSTHPPTSTLPFLPSLPSFPSSVLDHSRIFFLTLWRECLWNNHLFRATNVSGSEMETSNLAQGSFRRIENHLEPRRGFYQSGIEIVGSPNGRRGQG